MAYSQKRLKTKKPNLSLSSIALEPLLGLACMDNRWGLSSSSQSHWQFGHLVLPTTRKLERGSHDPYHQVPCVLDCTCRLTPTYNPLRCCTTGALRELFSRSHVHLTPLWCILFQTPAYHCDVSSHAACSLTPAYYSLRRGATGALRELVTGSRIAQRRLLSPEHAAAYGTLMGRVLQECGDHQTQVLAGCMQFVPCMAKRPPGWPTGAHNLFSSQSVSMLW